MTAKVASHSCTKCKLIEQMKPEKKLNYLRQYMDEWIDKRAHVLSGKTHPQITPIKTFEIWIESTIDKKKHKGRVAATIKKKQACRYCRRSFDVYTEKTKDHIIPISKGGLNRKENRVFSCSDCNSWKADKGLTVWLKEIKQLVKKGKTKIPYDLQSLV